MAYWNYCYGNLQIFLIIMRITNKININKLVQIGTLLNLNGLKSKMTFWSDGTISNGLLLDQSGNNRHAKVSTNAIRNADCELNYNMVVATGAPVLTHSTEQAHSGTHSFKVVALQNEGVKTSPFYAKAGATYNYSFWAYLPVGTSGIHVVIYNGLNNNAIVNAAGTTIASNQWVNITGTYTETTGGGNASIGFRSWGLAKTFYIDDISVTSSDPNDLYVEFPKVTALSDNDLTNKLFDTSANPLRVFAPYMYGYYDNKLFYNGISKMILFTSEQFGNEFILAHDFLQWNPITSITNVKTVKKDGTGNYTTIQAALAAITDATANKRYRIDIYDDWTVTEKASYTLSDTVFYRYLIMKDYVYLNGVGASKMKITCSITSNSSDADTTYYEPLDANKVTGLNNLEITMKNGRYALHHDTVTTSYFYNCKFVNYGISDLVAYRVANSIAAGSPFDGASIGQGTKDSSLGYFYNCEVGGKKPFETHDYSDMTIPSLIMLTKCSLLTTDTVSVKSQALGNTAVRNILQLNKCICNGLIEYYGYLYYTGAAANVNYLMNSMILKGKNNSYSGIINTLTGGGSLRITSATSGAVHITGGTAQTLIMPTPDEELNYSTGRMEVGEWALNANTKLGVRLGDCSLVNKTLTLTVDGVAETVTFNQNFTAQTNAQILTFINAALIGATASLYQRGKDYMPVI